MKYLYLLKFKDEPLIKIGKATNNLSDSYERIKQHMRTYQTTASRKAFDLDASYIVIAPNNNIGILESDLKDLTKSYIPDAEILSKYKGKDGYTEIRTDKSLHQIIIYFEAKQQFPNVVLDIKKGIKFPKPKSIVVKKEIVKKEKRQYKPFELTPDNKNFDYFFKYQYLPCLSNVNSWSITDTLEKHHKKGEISYTYKGYFLKLSIEKSCIHEIMKELNLDFYWQNELSFSTFPWCFRHINFNGKELRNIEYYVRERKNFDYNPDRDIVYLTEEDFKEKFGGKDLESLTLEEFKELDYLMYVSSIDKRAEYEALYAQSETLSAEITFGIFDNDMKECPEYLNWFIIQFVEPLRRLNILEAVDIQGHSNSHYPHSLELE